MTQSRFDPDRVLRLFRADAAPLGTQASMELDRLAESFEAHAREQLAGPDPEPLADVQRFHDRELVDQLQQAVHDLHLDTTWPACPRHPNHPLWYDEGHGAWCCPRDGAPLAPLGGLAALRNAA